MCLVSHALSSFLDFRFYLQCISRSSQGRACMMHAMLEKITAHLQCPVCNDIVACLVRQSLYRQTPLYLADDCCVVSDCTRRSLRSADVPTCVVPRTLSSYGDRAFAAAGSRLWNSLLMQQRNGASPTDCSDDS